MVDMKEFINLLNKIKNDKVINRDNVLNLESFSGSTFIQDKLPLKSFSILASNLNYDTVIVLCDMEVHENEIKPIVIDIKDYKEKIENLRLVVEEGLEVMNISNEDIIKILEKFNTTLTKADYKFKKQRR